MTMYISWDYQVGVDAGVELFEEVNPFGDTTYSVFVPTKSNPHKLPRFFANIVGDEVFVSVDWYGDTYTALTHYLNDSDVSWQEEQEYYGLMLEFIKEPKS